MLTTIVRSLVGASLELPGAVSIRPWHYVELDKLTTEQVDVLEVYLQARHVQVSQLVDGHPLSSYNLRKAVV